MHKRLSFGEFQTALHVDEAVRAGNVFQVRSLLGMFDAETRQRVLQGAGYRPPNADYQDCLMRVPPLEIALELGAPAEMRRLLIPSLDHAALREVVTHGG